MKKQFQILSIVVTILFFSCGRHNVETAGTITPGVKECSTNSASLSDETDLLLIDTEGQLRFNTDPENQAKKLQNRSSARTETTYTIDRNGLTKTTIRLNELLVVN